MAVGDTRVSWLSHTKTNTTFFPKPPTTFLACFNRGDRGKNAGKKVRLNRGSNQVMSLTRSPLSHLGWAHYTLNIFLTNDKILDLSKLKAFINHIKKK